MGGDIGVRWSKCGSNRATGGDIGARCSRCGSNRPTGGIKCCKCEDIGGSKRPLDGKLGGLTVGGV
jgi:hypothetical protein